MLKKETQNKAISQAIVYYFIYDNDSFKKTLSYLESTTQLDDFGRGQSQLTFYC